MLVLGPAQITFVKLQVFPPHWRDGVSLMSVEKFIISPSRGSFLQTLRDITQAARNTPAEDPWEPTLRRLKGRVAPDGVARISTNDVFDALEIPMRRRPSLTVRLSRVMRRLGWMNVRARGLNPGSYRDRVRGYAREIPGHPETIRRPNEF
jgi:hypothetical protein